MVGKIKLGLQLLLLQPAELLLSLGCYALLPLSSALHFHNHGLVIIISSIIKIVQIIDGDLLTYRRETRADLETSVSRRSIELSLHASEVPCRVLES